MKKKYVLKTETETLFLDKLEQKEEFIYVEQTGNLYRILDDNETELQPDALLSVSDGSEKEKGLCVYAWFKNAKDAFECAEYNKNIATKVLAELQMMESEDANEKDMDNTPKTYVCSYLFNYFGGDSIDGRKIDGVTIDVVFIPYKNNNPVRFKNKKETSFYSEEKSRLIGTRKTKIDLADAVRVSFDRDELVKLTRKEDIIKIICEHFGWDKIEISIIGYQLTYEEKRFVSIEWDCGKDVCIHFMETHKDDLDITDNRNAQCPAYRWLEE